MADWKERFITQMGIRRAIVLHGNVRDCFYAPGSLQGENVVTMIANTVRTMPGNYEIVHWNPQTGVTSLSPHGNDILNSACQAASSKGSEQADRSAARQRSAMFPAHSGNSETATPYDLSSGSSPSASSTSASSRGQAYDMHSGSSPSASSSRGEAYDLGPDIRTQPNVSAIAKDPIQFFSVLTRRFSPFVRKEQPCVFILDWADSLFGNAGSLSESERRQLLLLSQTLRDSSCSLDQRDSQKPEDLLILLTSKLEAIPSSFYNGNPAVSLVQIPLPDRPERAEILRSCCTSFRCEEEIAPNSPVFEELTDALEGYTRRDIAQLLRLSHVEREKLPIRKLLNIYKYGEKSSPWEDLNKERIANLETELKSQVKGQDHVIERVVKVIRKAFTGLSGLQHSGKQQMPKGILFFVGPTGVGKTETAKALARFLFQDEDACIRFDMSEYNHEHSDQRLVGAPPGYTGYEEGGQLTNAVRNRPFSVLLFDEIEKAHPRILDKFLQILEDGRLTDGKGETVSFSESVIVFTSNIGASEVSPEEPNLNEWFKERVSEHFKTELQRPELLNRIGVQNILPFHFLTDQTVLKAIMKSKLKPLCEKLREKYAITDLVLEDEDALLAKVLNGYDTRNGGRGVANRLDELIIEPLADWLFQEWQYNKARHLAGRKVIVSCPQSQIRFTFQ